MKKIFTIAAMMLLAATSFAQDGKSIYKKYSEADNVSAVYISPAMFRMMGRIPDLEVGDGDMNLTPVIKSLTGMYLIDSENKKINANIKKDVEEFVKSGSYEILMEAKDDGETVRVYVVSHEETVSSFVLLAYEPNECTFICLDGQMAKKQLEELMAKVGK
ncbi:MAG: DUF4252 domain-containing protein [Bacteroidales bacterium]|nr:DUF4252 domain-containing protein [Bacteroidales bacterium]